MKLSRDWVAGTLELEGADPTRLLQALNTHGSWIAYVGPHNVVIDGLDPGGNVLVRDPTPSGVSGSRYRVSLEVFLQVWGGGGVFRKAGPR